jgi:hypothetical protein
MAEGYDTNRFHSSVQESFICAICLGVLQDPMQCENNEHYFCSGCIKKHLEKTSHSCPTCQEKLTIETLRKAPRVVVECVSHYKISCDHATRGCDAVLELGDLQAHVRDCDFMPVSCSNEGCDEVLSKRDVKHHVIELCRFKTTTCDDCGKKMPHHKYAAHGCVLRRDFDEMKKDLAEVKVTQHEMMNEMREGMQRITIAIEKLEKSSRNVANVVNSMNSDIVLIGGVDRETENNKALSSVERFNFLNQTWTPLAELKIGRIAPAAVVFENQILVCGGVIGDLSGDPTDSIEVLDLNVNPPTWQEFAVNLPIKVNGHKCVVYGNRLLIIGGRTMEKILDAIYELLLVPPYSSKLLCRMKRERIFHGVEIFDDKVLIAGGQGAETDVEIFDITRNECVEMPPLPSPLLGMATVRRDDTMLLVGGHDNEDNFRNEIIEYDFKSGQSKVLVVMETKGKVCSAVYSGNTLVVIRVTDDDPGSVDCFNFLSNSWKKLPSITKARTFFFAVVVNNFVY